ncbi:unnamed protein product [Soboliphyme baturini]|uniref:Uncharacterized protein n=1 Tax=Soboliphyme baturini TaxID=241478 RepID=A0A183J1W7_9BILA|nr:unnamed protein product [Soboliphyme baturini]
MTRGNEGEPSEGEDEASLEMMLATAITRQTLHSFIFDRQSAVDQAYLSDTPIVTANKSGDDLRQLRYRCPCHRHCHRHRHRTRLVASSSLAAASAVVTSSGSLAESPWRRRVSSVRWTDVQ